MSSTTTIIVVSATVVVVVVLVAAAVSLAHFHMLSVMSRSHGYRTVQTVTYSETFN